MIMLGDRKKQVAAILGPEDGEKHKDHEEDSLHTIASELIDCIHSKDVEGAAAALRAAFMECDSEPHHEGPHIDEE